MSERPYLPGFDDVVAAVRRRAWAGGIVAVAVALIVATSIGPPGEVFQAVARVATPAAHEEQPASPADEFGENLATEIELARASPAGLRAVERIGADATVLASQVTTSGLVDVAVTAATEAAAIDGANGFADAYVAERSAALAHARDEAIERVDERLDELQADTASDADERALLEREREALVSDSVIDIGPAVIRPATTTTRLTSGRDLPQRLALAGGTGAAAGLGVAFPLELLSRRVHSRRDLEHLFPDARVLAELPSGEGSGSDASRERAWRDAAIGIDAASAGSAGAVVVVVAAVDGATGVAAAARRLAQALAGCGRVTIVVDGTDDDSLSAVLGVERGPGWADVAAGRATLDECLHVTDDAGRLAYIGAGAVAGTPPNPDGGRRAIAELVRRCDAVVVAGRPGSPSTGPEVLAPVTDWVVLTVRCGTSPDRRGRRRHPPSSGRGCGPSRSHPRGPLTDPPASWRWRRSRRAGPAGGLRRRRLR